MESVVSLPLGLHNQRLKVTTPFWRIKANSFAKGVATFISWYIPRNQNPKQDGASIQLINVVPELVLPNGKMDCKDFHQAKDGDGWVEQSSQPFLFGLLQKVAPTAYVCADSKIYDATDWYICQGMRCPANSHMPSFHVNTSITSKHNTSKGSSSGQRSGRMPTLNMEETMTEE
ncbi:hypothetical protein NC651_020270 [Populus alba x Populus x berolinensis]|nr:hypothetical protein NC651_020270 [Populus alba x Populus x berolinensis]